MEALHHDIDVIDFIKTEHRHLLENFDRRLKETQTSGAWREFYQYCLDHFEDNHHTKEERHIFALVKENPKLRAGGPLCGMYFDAHLHHPSLELAIRMALKTTGLNLAPQWSPLMQEIVNLNLPLVIPGSDHEAGRILLRAAEKLLVEAPTPSVVTGLNEIFQLYREIQMRHFEREENCFLPMCRELIPKELWAQLVSQMCAQYPFINS